MTKYIAAILLIGLIVFSYSLSLDPFTDNEVFNQKYSELSVGQSKEFFELRDSMLTPKYHLQDIGISLILISTLILIFFKMGNGYIKSPPKKYLFIILAVLLPFLTVSGFVFDLSQGMFRNEFPHWADSLGIPLAGVPFQFIILLIWSSLHLLFLRKKKISSVIFKVSNLKQINLWLIIISIFSFILVILELTGGHYWYAIPGLFWIYYYLSLGIVRVGNQTPNKTLDDE
ncbi:MAG TPA: hypothetical protein ENK91_06230 [Bacteroidetes bacterium]|nr:hypothetical protein [Bacteroidota bacterium]